MVDIIVLKEATCKLSVLYVEDEEDIRASMSKYLKKFFSLVDTASNGLEGLTAFKKDKYDIVITDLAMPKLSGIAMITKMKEIDENQGILITTAHSDANYLLEAIKAHVDGYIIKPFNSESLNTELLKISCRINTFKENENYKRYLQDMLIKQTHEINDNFQKTLYFMIDLIERRDSYTAGHSRRVALYCDLIAKEMGYDQGSCALIHQAATLHDLGKIETPDAVLLNPKSLSKAEHKLMQGHVGAGYKLLNSIPMFQPIAQIVQQHHEKCDGSGYPNGLKGDEICDLAKIMIVADAFDAMTTNRVYKGKKTVKEALEEIRDLSGKHFHPEVAKSAVAALGNVFVDEYIGQLPQNKLEEERFAYFYKDSMSKLYNQNYLEIILLKNYFSPTFKNMFALSITDFSQYNKKYGWTKASAVLKEFSAILLDHLEKELIFRAFGDYFFIVSEDEIELEDVQKALNDLMQKSSLDYRVIHIDLLNNKIEGMADLEALCL